MPGRSRRLHGVFGNIDLLVREASRSSCRTGTRWAGRQVETGSGIPGARRVVLTGGTFFGDVKVRHRRLWEKLARLGESTG